jgi:hypothetical protein
VPLIGQCDHLLLLAIYRLLLNCRTGDCGGTSNAGCHVLLRDFVVILLVTTTAGSVVPPPTRFAFPSRQESHRAWVRARRGDAGYVARSRRDGWLPCSCAAVLLRAAAARLPLLSAPAGCPSGADAAAARPLASVRPFRCSLPTALSSVDPSVRPRSIRLSPLFLRDLSPSLLDLEIADCMLGRSPNLGCRRPQPSLIGWSSKLHAFIPLPCYHIIYTNTALAERGGPAGS